MTGLNKFIKQKKDSYEEDPFFAVCRHGIYVPAGTSCFR
jgi:hypothetical protein